MLPFTDPQAVARYAEAPARLRPRPGRLPVLAPEQDEALLREAGFSDVSLFYAGFSFRGWVAYKGEVSG